MIYYLKGRFVGRGSRVASNGKTYYSFALMQNMDSIQLGCTEEVFNQLEGYDELDDVICCFTENVKQGKNGTFISRYVIGLGETD